MTNPQEETNHFLQNALQKDLPNFMAKTCTENLKLWMGRYLGNAELALFNAKTSM